MSRRYLVFSDLHLADIEDHDDGWKAYKSSRFVFDNEFAELVLRFADEAAPDDDLTVVLNGDILDFDLVCAVPEDPPWPVSVSERKRGLEPTDEKSTWKIQQILADHPVWVDTLARFASAGHRVVYVIGNHDPELHFAGVRRAFIGHIAERAEALDLPFDESRVTVEPWFYYVPGDIYIEHGHQYDYYSAVRYPLSPILTSNKPPTIALPMGNLANRYLLTNMGFFNPNASDYIRNVYGYLTHWLRHYAFTKRSLVFNWLIGSILVVLRLLRTKKKELLHPPDNKALCAAEAQRKGIDVETINALRGLQRVPMSSRVYRMVREFWIDRLVLVVVMIGGTILLALLPIPLWIKLMVPLSSFPLVYLVYEWFAHGDTIFNIEREFQDLALEVAKLLPVKVITFGHTHVPILVPLLPDVSYVNTGTWAPLYKRKSRVGQEVLLTGYRNVLFAHVSDNESGGNDAIVRLESCVARTPQDKRRARRFFTWRFRRRKTSEAVN